MYKTTRKYPVRRVLELEPEGRRTDFNKFKYTKSKNVGHKNDTRSLREYRSKLLLCVFFGRALIV